MTTTASRYDTPVACPVCPGTLAMDSTGAVYCMTHGADDVPSIDEAGANVADGFTVERHPGNGVLYVVSTGDAVDVLRERARDLASRLRHRGYTPELREFPADGDDVLTRFYVTVVLTQVPWSRRFGMWPPTVWTQLHESYPWGQKPSCGGGATWETPGATEVGLVMADCMQSLRRSR